MPYRNLNWVDQGFNFLIERLLKSKIIDLGPCIRILLACKGEIVPLFLTKPIF